MSTIPIQSLVASRELRKDRLFNSLFASYATTQKKPCGGCRKRRTDMTVCKTLLNSLITSRRGLLEATFGIPTTATLSVYCSGTDLGIRVK